MAKAKINTSFELKPIPLRTCDWTAWRGDYDLDNLIGCGATEADAVVDLLELEEMTFGEPDAQV